nr:hypothetical protein [Tanacetum cinerariifolium]
MSNAGDSTVTYTKESSSFEDLSGIGFLGVDGLPMMPQDPYAYLEAALQALPSLDYVPGLEHPPSPAYTLEFFLEPVYSKFMSPDNTDSPGYILESDPREDLEEDPEEDDEDPKEDPTDYPTDREDDEEEEKKESSGDDADDKDEDEDEEEEHPAPADSIPPPPVHHTTVRISLPTQAPIPFLLKAEVERLLALPTPPPSPLTPYSSLLPQIPSPPLSVSSPLPISPLSLPASPTYPLGYKAAMIRLRAKLPSTSYSLPSSTSPSGTPPLLPIPLPTSSPPLLLPSTSRRANVLEVTLPPQKRLCIALGLRYEVDESSSAPTTRPTRGFGADYGFVCTLDDEIRRDPEREVGYGIIDTWQDADEIYGRLDDARDDRLLMSGQLNMLRKNRRSHAYSARLMDSEARLSRKAWVQSVDASDTASAEVISLRTTVLAHQSEIVGLRAIDRT